MNEEPYKICLRLNADEAQKLITNAKACGLTRTAYLRRLLNGYDLKPRPSAELEALRTEIHQIGNNINQLAAKANALGFIDTPMLKNEALRWHKLQAAIEREYLRPEKSNLKWQ